MAEAATTRDDRSAAGPLRDDSACWAAPPPAVEGSGRPLPAWACAMAVHLPRTVAAPLELDLAHRTRSPLPPDLRAGMRWVIAMVNRSAHGEAHAPADVGWVAGPAAHDWSAFPPPERRAYAYARKLSAASWELPAADYAGPAEDLGPSGAMSAFFWLCRGLSMTRVSDGFGPPLERDNEFRDDFTPATTDPGSHP